MTSNLNNNDADDPILTKFSNSLLALGKVASVPLISIIVAGILGIIILLFMNFDPIRALSLMTIGTLEPTKIYSTLFYATPLIFTGLSVAVAFRAGMFNIGTEGQMLFGAFLTALVGFGLRDYFNIHLPPYIYIPLLITVGAVGGAVWALIPAILKARGVHEVITTIMMNYIALTLLIFLVGDLSAPFTDKSKTTGNVSPQTPLIPESAWIPTVFGRGVSPLHWGLLLGIIACFVVFIILWKTKLGYEARAVGHNPSAAKYGGINVSRNLIYVMLISGALGGLAGSIEVLGYWHRFLHYSLSGYGFDGIAVAIIGGNHPIGVLFGALLFGWLQTAGNVLQIAQIPKDIANTLKGFIVFFVAIPLLAKAILSLLNRTTRGQQLIVDGKSFASNVMHKKYQIIQSIITSAGLLVVYLIYAIFSVGGFFLAPFRALTFLDPISPYISRFSFYIPIYTLNLFTVVSILLFLAFFAGYFLVRHKEYLTRWTINLFLVGSGIFGTTTYLNMNSMLRGEIVLLLIIVLVTAFILVQELRAYVKKRRKIVHTLKTEEKVDGKQKGLMMYGIATITVLVLTILIAFLGYEVFPFPLGLFFFRLETFGGFIGFVGIIIVIIFFILLSKMAKTPKNKSEIYYLPYAFRIASVILAFLAVVYIFKMNSFLLLRMTLSIAAPIGLASLGGMFSEKSGVVNIALEGKMLTGAFVAVWISYITRDPWAGVIGAIVAGALMGLLFAIASIKFRANQVVAGVAINLLASALTTLGIVAVWQVSGTSEQSFGLPKIKFSIFQDLPILGDFLFDLTGGGSGLDPLVYVFIALTFISAWIIGRTSFGLRVRAVGEHPRAADTLGINVYKTRYICVTLSGIFAALGGAQLTLGTVPVFVKNMTTGRGFVALAALIFGAWAPIGAAMASLLFAFAFAFRFQLEAMGINWVFMNLHLEKLTPSLPYVITIVAVSTIARRMRPPAADGIPYTKEGT